jgi:hypothetical protein
MHRTPWPTAPPPPPPPPRYLDRDLWRHCPDQEVWVPLQTAVPAARPLWWAKMPLQHL